MKESGSAPTMKQCNTYIYNRAVRYAWISWPNLIGIFRSFHFFNFKFWVFVAENLYFLMKKCIFLPSGPKVPLSLPAPDRECCTIFVLARQKNPIRTMGANKGCLRSHVCHQFTYDLGHSLLLLPRCVIYYFHHTRDEMRLFESLVLVLKKSWHPRSCLGLESCIVVSCSLDNFSTCIVVVHDPKSGI